MQMKYTIIFFAIIGTSLGVSVTSRTTVDRDSGSIHPTYNCSATAYELNDHPTDCTRYIQCDNGQAWDKPCAACDQNNVAGCQGEKYTHFQRSVDPKACIWPKDGTCKATPPPTTTTPSSTTTDDSIVTTLKPGEECLANNCTVEGDCFGYRYCERNSEDPADNSGTVVEKKCDAGEYFEPRASSVVASCVIWDDLHPDTKAEYLSVKGCTYCEIKALGHCLPQYQYRNENGVVSTETCLPLGHVYSENLGRCVYPAKC